MTKQGRPLGMRRNFRICIKRQQPPGRSNRCCARCRLLDIPNFFGTSLPEYTDPLECYCTREPRLKMCWAEARYRTCTGWRKPHEKVVQDAK